MSIRTWPLRLLLMAACTTLAACSLLSLGSRERAYWDFGIVAKSLGPEELTEVEVISGHHSFGFGFLGTGEASVDQSNLPPDEPWTLVWRDSKQKLHVVPLKIDPAQIPRKGEVVIEIRSPDVKVSYRERP